MQRAAVVCGVRARAAGHGVEPRQPHTRAARCELSVSRSGYQLVSLRFPFLWLPVFHAHSHPTADLGSHSHQSWAPLED